MKTRKKDEQAYIRRKQNENKDIQEKNEKKKHILKTKRDTREKNLQQIVPSNIQTQTKSNMTH